MQAVVEEEEEEEDNNHVARGGLIGRRSRTDVMATVYVEISS